METKKTVTLGRETGSGGYKIGEMLAVKLGVRYYDKELLDRVAKESSPCRELLGSNDKRPTNSFLYSLIMDAYSPDCFFSPYVGMPINQKISLTQSDTIRNLTQQESYVTAGHCADYVLDGIPGVLLIFISAAEEDRVTRIQDYQGGNISRDKTREIMLKTDKWHSSYYSYYFNRRWGDSRSYDLCINGSKFGLESVVQLILDSLRRGEKSQNDNR